MSNVDENYGDVIGDIGAMIGECATTTSGQTIKQHRGAYKPKTKLGLFVQCIVNETMEKFHRGERICAFQCGDMLLSPGGKTYTLSTTFWCNPKNVNDQRAHGIVLDSNGVRTTIPMCEIENAWVNLTTQDDE